jgi:hypothetical protein
LGEKQILLGSGYETILLSSDGGQTLSRKFVGGGYGSIVSMLGGTWGGWEFAAMERRGIVFSVDHGSNWSTLGTKLSSYSDRDCATVLSGAYLTLEQRPYQQIVWGINRYSTGQPILLKILPGYFEYDSVTVHCQEIPSISSSTVSAFAANYDWSDSHGIYNSSNFFQNFLWIGTWGQGLFVSKDEGKTWASDNEGLDNLFVEDIWISTRGTALVLTKGGMYRKVVSLTSSVQSLTVKGKHKWTQAFSQGTPVLRSKSGTPYTIDGRGILIR